MKPQLQFAGTVCTGTPSADYTPGRLNEMRMRKRPFNFWRVFRMLLDVAKMAARGEHPLCKVFRSLPLDQENEAVRDFDRQIDQVVFQSPFLAKLSSSERQGENYDQHYDGLFWYVFGYAQAKGWTDIEIRFGEADRRQKIIDARWAEEKLREDVKCDDCAAPLNPGEGAVILLGERNHETTGRCCSACYHKNHE